MKKLYFNPDKLKGLKIFDDYIEKAQRGEQIGGEYLYREDIGEKISTSNGKKVVRHYRYYYPENMLKDSAASILKKIGQFFFKKNPLEKKEKSYQQLGF